MRLLSSMLCLLSATALYGRVAVAQHLPHQTATPFPFRCPQAGICLQATGKADVIGGVRHGDHEIRFHAMHMASKEDAKSSDPWCIAISDTKGRPWITGAGGHGCDQLDQNDVDVFGYKPTVEPNDGSDGSDKDNSERNKDDGEETSRASADAVGCLTHLAHAELRPDHAEAWAAVRALAQQWLREHDDEHKD